jgi:DNA-binding NarL/FixJ family response regulator
VTGYPQMRVLIVDDQDDVRVLLRLVIDIANEGLVVVGDAASGVDALGQVDSVDPSIIVLDEMMPGMNGIEVATEILARRPEQLIVLFSAHLDDTLREKAMQAGVTRWLSKSQLDDLPDVLRELCLAN